MVSPYVYPGLKGTTFFAATHIKLERLRTVLVDYAKRNYTKHYTWTDVMGKSRKRELVVLRQVYCYFCMKNGLLNSLKEVGETIGSRDHTTVIHSCKTVKDLLSAKDEKVTNVVNYVNNNI